MKRSTQIKLILLGLGAAAAGGCGSREKREEPRITTESYYPNDHYIAGAGYYHAPFRAFFPQRYNQFDAERQQYYYGGTWADRPFASHINISTPMPEAVKAAESARHAVTRGGFGHTGSSHSISS